MRVAATASLFPELWVAFRQWATDEQNTFQTRLTSWGKGRCHEWADPPAQTQPEPQPSLPALAFCIQESNSHGSWRAGVMCSCTGTVYFWHEEWTLHADSALPAPWPQIHRQIAAASLRLRVLWLGAYQGGAGTQDLAFKLSSTQLIQILNLASDCLPFI